MLEIGSQAPNPTIKTWPDYEGPIGKFWKDGPLILYFYPMDNTPVCTRQACTLQDSIAEFGQFKANVLGSSTGSSKTHQGYAKKNSISFPLVADRGSKLAKAFDSNRFLVPISKRITYVMAKGGKIIGRCHDEMDVEAHLAMIRETLDELK